MSPDGSVYPPASGTMTGSPTGSARTGAGQSCSRLAGLQARGPGDGDAAGAVGGSMAIESTIALELRLDLGRRALVVHGPDDHAEAADIQDPRGATAHPAPGRRDPGSQGR